MKVYIYDEDPAAVAETDKVSYNIYFSGCSIRCPGCHNPQMWDMKSGTLKEVDDVLKGIRENAELVDAVCFLGGEPTDQLEALVNIASRIENMELWLYTGRTEEEVRNLGIAHLFDKIKVGNYQPEAGAGKDLITSNQYIIDGSRAHAN